MTPKEAAEDLRNWAANPHMVQTSEVTVALRLANHADMEWAWHELLKPELQAEPWLIRRAATDAYDKAMAEIRRPAIKSEARQFQRVRDAALALKEAVEGADLSEWEQTNYPLRLGNVMFRWKGSGESNVLFTAYNGEDRPSLALTDLMDTVVELLDRHRRRLPLRAVAKHRQAPATRAFVCHLTYFMLERFGKKMAGTVGRITTAVLDLPKPLDSGDVESILKTAPEPFLNPRPLFPPPSTG